MSIMINMSIMIVLVVLLQIFDYFVYFMADLCKKSLGRSEKKLAERIYNELIDNHIFRIKLPFSSLGTTC
jgi:hypothetical protein